MSPGTAPVWRTAAEKALVAMGLTPTPGLGVALFGFVYLVSPGVSAPDGLGALLMALSGISWDAFPCLPVAAVIRLQPTPATFFYASSLL